MDIEQHDELITYLRTHNLTKPDELPEIRNLAGGVSNRTVLVKRPSGEAWVLKQALEKLRVQVDWYSSPERVHKEALGMRWLAELAPSGSITPLVFEDTEEHVIIMQAVPEPHANWKTLLLKGHLWPQHIVGFGKLLAAIHGNSYRRRDELARVFADRSFFESLRLEPYYLYTASQVPEAAPFLNALVEETRVQRLALVHGDYAPKNVLITTAPAGDQMVLLDHEVIHFGDPAFDLGFSLTHFLSKAHYLPDLRERFAISAATYWDVYRNELEDLGWTRDLEPRAVRHTLGCMLARVRGRSPLEYLSEAERDRQAAVITDIIATPPTTVSELAETFVERLDAYA